MAKYKTKKSKAQAGRKINIPGLATNPYVREEDVIAPPPDAQPMRRPTNPVVDGIRKGIIEPYQNDEGFYPYDPTIDVAQAAYDFAQQPGTGRMVENPYVKDFNILATTATGIGNLFQNNKLKNEERLQAMLAQEPTYWENMEAEGLNNIPMYTQYGGGPKYKTGGGVSVAKAKEILRDGTINGEPLTEKQKNYFGWIAGGSKPRKQTGGTPNTNGQSTGTATANTRRRLSPGEMQQWNMFLDYVKDKGYEGSADLNKKNKNLGASLFADFKKANPNIGIDYSIVPDVQNEMQMLGQSARDFAKRRNDPNAENLMTGVSPVDGWFGSKTSQYRFPEQQTVVYNNGQLVSATNDGLLTSNLQATGVPNLNAQGQTTSSLPTNARPKKPIPKGVTVEKLADGYYYEDPQSGDLVRVEMKYGGKAKRKQTGGNGSIPVVKGLPDDMSQFANVEAEAGEIVEGANGAIVKISDQEKRHEQGGVDLANVNRVLEDTSTKRKDKASKTLQISKDEAENMLGIKIKKPVSHAKAFELATDNLEKKQKEYQKSTKNSNLVDELTNVNVNTMELNAMFESMLPTTDDIFNLLYGHQEAVKESNGIADDGSMKMMGGSKSKLRYCRAGGKPKAQAGIGTYSGGRTKAGSTTPTGNPNAFAFPGGLDAYKAAWNPLLNLDQYNTVQSAQAATYDYLVKNQPDVAASIWQSQGLTAKGRQLIQSDPNFAAVASQVFDNTGKLKAGVNLTPEQLAALQPAYADNMLGIRAITPSQLTTTTQDTYPKTTPNVTGTTPQQPRSTGVTINPLITSKRENEFLEPTYWSDIASPLISLADSMKRSPELYNPVEFNQLRLKQLDPTAAMNANQADFNAAVDQIGNLDLGSGSQAANIANLAGQKYRVNNQVQGQYDNQNAQIKNQEIQYNTQVRDRQSVANAKTRDDYYNRVLLSRENQRLQQLKSIEDLARVDQMKRRQNRSGNLLLKLSPAFDQFGEYNGYQYMPYLPPELGVGYNMNQPTPAGKTNTRASGSKTTTTTTFKDASGRTIKKTTKQ
jgi:hypothetical protein